MDVLSIRTRERVDPRDGDRDHSKERHGDREGAPSAAPPWPFARHRNQDEAKRGQLEQLGRERDLVGGVEAKNYVAEVTEQRHRDERGRRGPPPPPRVELRQGEVSKAVDHEKRGGDGLVQVSPYEADMDGAGHRHQDRSSQHRARHPRCGAEPNGEKR